MVESEQHQQPDEQPDERPDQRPDQEHRRRGTLLHGRSGFGTFLAVVAFLVSFAPSLLPRTWEFQAVAAGLSAATAYAAGALVESLVRPFLSFLGLRVVVEPRRRRLALGLVVLAVLALVAWVGYEQRQGRVLTARLVDMPPPSVRDDLLALGGGVVVALVVVLAVVALRIALAGSRVVLRLALPAWVARVVALVLVAAVVVWASNQFLVQRTLESVSAAAARLNDTTADVPPPTSSLRSGGPGSTQPWSELGFNGQNFTARGPDAAAISAATGRPAREPIRVYASLRSGMSLDEVADNVVAELRRTGAFDREVLTLIGTTGRGWVDEYNVASVEYLSDGDTATAAMQYSYLASPIAFLTSREAPAEAGRLLFDKVYAVWRELPEGERPRLYVSGESLGAFGGTAPFRDADELLAQVDGAVWIGTPSFTPLWRSVTAERLRGSPQVTPVYDQGRHIRFATDPDGLDRDDYGREYGEWQTPRVVFLQHASDPIVWWSPSLALQEPDWIREGAGVDVNPDLRWWPLVTFWQVTLDMAMANEPPAGHGHIYQDDLVPVWDAVLHSRRTGSEELGRITTALRAAAAEAPSEGEG